jgi:hypothetical protein
VTFNQDQESGYDIFSAEATLKSVQEDPKIKTTLPKFEFKKSTQTQKKKPNKALSESMGNDSKKSGTLKTRKLVKSVAPRESTMGVFKK